MIPATNEHRENKHQLTRLVDVEPASRPPDSEMPQSMRDIVMALALMWVDQDALCVFADLQHPRLGMIERTLRNFAEAKSAVQQMVDNKSEVAFGFDRKLKT